MRWRLPAAVLLLPLLGGCAFTNAKNTPLLTYLDNNVRPETRAEEIGLAPLAVPVAMTCGALDIAVLHPIQASGNAAADTWDILWAKPGGAVSRQVLEFPLKAVGTPVVFAFIWLNRSLFDVERLSRPPERPERKEPARPITVDTFFAMSNPRNRRLLNLLEANIVPADPVARVAAGPVTVPAFLIGGVLDALVIHPAHVLDDACYDTAEAVWEPTDRGYFTECAILPFRLALTPPVWLMHFTSRWVFDTPPRPPDPDELGELLLDPDPRMRLLVVKPLERSSYTGADVAPATNAMIDACRAYPEDLAFCEALISVLPKPLTDEARAYLRELALRGQGRLCGAAILRLFQDCLYRPIVPADEALSEQEREARLEEEHEKHLERSVNFLATIYDELVTAGHHEAEVYLAALAYWNTRAKGARALGLYMLQSLAERDWPAYAEALSFGLQLRLLQTTPAGRIAAIQHEWRALRVQPTWPVFVMDFLRGPKRQLRAASDMSEKEVRRYMERIRRAGKGDAMERYNCSERLATAKTVLDAAETAEELWKGPKDDLELFRGMPLERLIEKGER
ncbi:MAG: hypothetical protein R6V58_00515 [Planctomycetota bacterium]